MPGANSYISLRLHSSPSFGLTFCVQIAEPYIVCIVLHLVSTAPAYRHPLVLQCPVRNTASTLDIPRIIPRRPAPA